MQSDKFFKGGKKTGGSANRQGRGRGIRLGLSNVAHNPVGVGNLNPLGDIVCIKNCFWLLLPYG